MPMVTVDTNHSVIIMLRLHARMCSGKGRVISLSVSMSVCLSVVCLFVDTKMSNLGEIAFVKSQINALVRTLQMRVICHN